MVKKRIEDVGGWSEKNRSLRRRWCWWVKKESKVVKVGQQRIEGGEGGSRSKTCLPSTHPSSHLPHFAPLWGKEMVQKRNGAKKNWYKKMVQKKKWSKKETVQKNGAKKGMVEKRTHPSPHLPHFAPLGGQRGKGGGKEMVQQKKWHKKMTHKRVVPKKKRCKNWVRTR